MAADNRRDPTANIRLAYYPGCTAESICRELDDSTRAIAPILGIDLVDIPWNCCGAGTFSEFGSDFHLASHARVFALCEEQGVDLVTVCNTCLMTLSRTNQAMKTDQAVLARANEMLAGTGLSYSGGVRVRHLLWVLIEDVGLERLSSLVTRPLTGLNIGPFYGCHIFRPSYALGFESHEKPRSLHDAIEAVGASAIDYDGFNKCCGFHVLLSREKAATDMMALRFEHAKEEGADVLVTPCPLCHVALDIYQKPAEERAHKDFDLPIIHFPQMIGLALGIDPHKLGLGKHLVSTRIINDRVGLQ